MSWKNWNPKFDFKIPRSGTKYIDYKQPFHQVYEEVSTMLQGTQPLDFERAVFITENAHRDNTIRYEDYKAAPDIHSVHVYFYKCWAALPLSSIHTSD